MTDKKQYPKLPDPTAWRSYDNLLKRARYNAMPITSMQPGIYSHTRMFTEDQMYAYVDADRAMRAAQAGPASQDTARLDWLTFNISGAALRAIGVEWSEHGDARKAIDAARAAKEGDQHG